MKNIFKDDDTYLARWLNDELSQEELTEFENSEDFATYNKIAERTSNLQTPSWDKSNTWNKISEKGKIINHKEDETKGVFHINWWRYAAAACVLAIVGYFSLIQTDNFETHQTFAAELQIINLPDGSKAFLNTASKIQFDRKSFDIERTIKLVGEAFFEVEKGSKFLVETENGDVRVLGTSFNVRSRASGLDVQCYTGRVGVSFNDFKDEEVLDVGDMIQSMDKRIIERIRMDDELIRPEWRDGRSKFVNVRFDEVINELERQFDIDIEADMSIRGIEKYNGGFVNNNLDSALKVVCASVSCDYKIEGKTVFLFKK